MKILFLYWDSCFCCVDMLEALADEREEKGGIEVVIADMQDPDSMDKGELDAYINKKLRETRADVLFSFGFFPLISDICEEKHVIYISWTFDDPAINLYSGSADNECNRIFVFDSASADRLIKAGAKNVWFLPMAVNPRRLGKFNPGNKEHDLFDADVSFVGSMYTEKHCLFDKMEPKLQDYTKGYLAGLMKAQLFLDGVNIIEDRLTPEILDDMEKAFPLKTEGRAGRKWVYASYVINRKITSMERCDIIENIGKNRRIRLYTCDAGFSPAGVENLGEIDYFHVMPYIFKCTAVNLNITLRSIIKGIPLRIFDIMGCGGFVLTNFQEDLLRFFEPGVDFVYWDDKSQIPEIIDHYLENAAERKIIAENAMKKVKSEHTFRHRLKVILDKI